MPQVFVLIYQTPNLQACRIPYSRLVFPPSPPDNFIFQSRFSCVVVGELFFTPPKNAPFPPFFSNRPTLFVAFCPGGSISSPSSRSQYLCPRNPLQTPPRGPLWMTLCFNADGYDTHFKGVRWKLPLPGSRVRSGSDTFTPKPKFFRLLNKEINPGRVAAIVAFLFASR